MTCCLAGKEKDHHVKSSQENKWKQLTLIKKEKYTNKTVLRTCYNLLVSK